MAKLNPYLNFDGTAEEAFNFYKTIFGGEFVGGIHKMGNAPGTENLSEEEKNSYDIMAWEIAVGKGGFGHRQRGVALVEQLLEVDHVRAESHAAQGFVVVVEAGFGEAHAPGQRPEHVGVGARLAHRCNGRAVEQHVGVAVAGVDVPVFELGGGRQQDVGVVGGVGAEVLQHHGEQVVARKAAHHLARQPGVAEVLGGGYGRRHFRGGTGEPLQPLRASRCLHHPAVWWHGARPVHRQAAGGIAGRHDRGAVCRAGRHDLSSVVSAAICRRVTDSWARR